MMDKGRILTLKVKIEDGQSADWIWEAHKAPVNGIRVLAIADGDKIAESETLASAAAFFIREDGEAVEEAIDAHCDGGFTTMGAAVEEAKNTILGNSWSIINSRGETLLPLVKQQSQENL